MAMTLPSATVTFLSDHGEAVGEKDSWFGHFDGPAPSQVYRIPLLFYISDQIQRRLGGLMSNFEANLSLAFQSDALIHVLLDLYGVVDPMRRDEKSLFSPTYQPLPRYCDELDVRIVHLQ
jgi:heptose-I-phosphate ethanolaminephosphotransferase